MAKKPVEPIKVTIKEKGRQGITHAHTSSLDELTGQKTARGAFVDYSRKTLANENVEFVFAFREIENDIESRVTATNPKNAIEKQKEFQERFQALYDKYIRVDGELAINVSSKERDVLENQNGNRAANQKQTTTFQLETFKLVFNSTKHEADESYQHYQNHQNLQKSNAESNKSGHLGRPSILITPSTAHQQNLALTWSEGSKLRTPPQTHTALRVQTVHASTQNARQSGSLHSDLAIIQEAITTDRTDVTDKSVHTDRTVPTDRTSDITGTPTLTPSAAQVLNSGRNKYSRLHAELVAHLKRIRRYQWEEPVCVCCCFKSCILNKPAIYNNIKSLRDTLHAEVKEWKAEKIQNLEAAILTAFQQHKLLAGNKEPEIFRTLSAALLAPATTPKNEKIKTKRNSSKYSP